jgi:hypothetical protein
MDSALPILLEKDLTQLHAGDIYGMLGNYHPDAQIMWLNDTAARGGREIRSFLEGYVALKPKIVAVMAAKERNDCILYHSAINLDGTVRGLVGTWVLRDGLIWRQTSVIVPSPR